MEDDERESSPLRPLPNNGGAQLVFISSYTSNYSLLNAAYNGE